MAENTKIEWAHHTFNPWIGCTKVSPACDHCYAEADFATRHQRRRLATILNGHCGISLLHRLQPLSDQ